MQAGARAEQEFAASGQIGFDDASGLRAGAAPGSPGGPADFPFPGQSLSSGTSIYQPSLARARVSHLLARGVDDEAASAQEPDALTIDVRR